MVLVKGRGWHTELTYMGFGRLWNSREDLTQSLLNAQGSLCFLLLIVFPYCSPLNIDLKFGPESMSTSNFIKLYKDMAFEALRTEAHCRNLIGQVWLTLHEPVPISYGPRMGNILELFPPVWLEKRKVQEQEGFPFKPSELQDHRPWMMWGSRKKET